MSISRPIVRLIILVNPPPPVVGTNFVQVTVTLSQAGLPVDSETYLSDLEVVYDVVP